MTISYKAEAKEEEQLAKFQIPLHVQVLCVGAPERELMGRSTRIPDDPTPNMKELIVKFKLALASKPTRGTSPLFITLS